MSKPVTLKIKTFEGISEERIKQVRECNTPEEMLAMAQEEGVELTDEELEAVSGGVSWTEGMYPCGACYGRVESIGDGLYKCVVCGAINRKP